MDIDQIIIQAKKGEIKSFELLYKKYKDEMINFIIRYRISREDAEEIYDDVFLYIHQSFMVFECDSREEKNE